MDGECRRLSPDPRSKLIVGVAFVASVAAMPSQAERFALLAALLVACFAVLRIPARTAALRALPLLGLVVAAGVGMTLGAPAIRTADLTARLVLISGAAIALTASTSPTEMLAAMRSIGAPRTLIAVLMLTSRYLHVLDDEARRSARAWRSRMVGVDPSRSGPVRCARDAASARLRHVRALGMVAATLVRRAVERSDRIAWAMVSRGFEGRLPTAPLSGIRIGDILIAAACIVTLAGVALWR